MADKSNSEYKLQIPFSTSMLRKYAHTVVCHIIISIIEQVVYRYHDRSV